MKKLILLIFLITTQCFSQEKLEVPFFELSSRSSSESNKAQIIGEWVKIDIRKTDSSRIYEDGIKNISLRYTFQEDNSLIVQYNGRTTLTTYAIQNQNLTINYVSVYKISYLDKNLLILDDVDDETQTDLKIILQRAEVYNMGFIPQFFVGKDADTVYIAKENYLEPKFMSTDFSASEFISRNFSFPEYKAGDFLARFVVTKTGKVRAVKVLSSTHEKYNENLMDAIRKTEGKWQPAVWNNQPVNVEIEIGFDMGWSEKQGSNKPNKDLIEKMDNQRLAKVYLAQGNDDFERKSYKRAITSYTLSIEKNYLNVDAYYMRAASYIATKQIEKACNDLLQLKHLEQTKGDRLYKKYCQKSTEN